MEGMNWARLYRLLEDITPLKEDCGGLCRRRCCSSTRAGGLGIYLFPGEEGLFDPEGDWYRIGRHPGGAGHFTGDSLYLLDCRGHCPREARPLACRIFPLAPHLDQSGDLNLILDDALRECVKIYSERVDREAAEPWRGLFK